MVRVGDVHVVVDGHHHPPARKLDEHLGTVRAGVLRQYLDLGCPLDEMRALDPGRMTIADAIRLARCTWNTPADGLGVARINGTHTPDGMIDVIDIAAAAEVVLATDGYIVPQATLDESEQALAERIARDPLMIESQAQTKGVPPGGSGFDDRLYLRVRLMDVEPV